MAGSASIGSPARAGRGSESADRRTHPPYEPSPVAAAYAWPALLAKDGDALFDHYRQTLKALGKQPGTLAVIFGKAQNKFREAKLRRVIVDLIDGQHRSAMGADVKGDIKLGPTSAVACGAAVLGISAYSPQNDAPQPEAT
jgi:hypothetical protein